MSIFDRFKRREEPDRPALVQAKSTMSWGGGRGYNAGDGFTRDIDVSSTAYSLPYLPVRENDARNSSIIASVVGWAMRNIVQVAPCVKHEGKGGEWEVAPKHLATRLIRSPQGQINAEDRAALNYRRMLRAIVWSLMFDGNGYLLKVRNGSKVIGLDWIPHQVVGVEERRDYPSVIERYQVRKSGGTKPVPREDMIHFTLGIDPDHPAIGCSPLKSVMRLVMTDNQIAVFSHAVLRNPFPGLILSPGDKDQRFESTDLALLLENIYAAAGGERGGGIAAFTDMLKVDKVGYSPDDMAVRELARLPEERITAVFGIPAIVCGMGAGLERSTFANFEQAREAATEEFLVPIWDDISETFTEQLLPEFEKSGEGRVELDYSGVKALQEDTDELHGRIREDFKANLIDRAEAKRKLGEEPGPEDEGVYFYQLRTGPTVDPNQNDMGQGKAVAKQTRLAAEGLA